MRLWIIMVLILFSLIQFYQWIKGIILPLPIYILSGSFLAIASNYNNALVPTIVSSYFQKQALISSEKKPKE